MLASTLVVAIAADAVGLASAGLGGFLTVAPDAAGRRLGLTATRTTPRRVLGVIDLTLGLAIIAGRSSHRRWDAVAVRALLHLVFAREYVRADRRGAAVAMCALFVIDSGIALALRRSRHST